MKRQKKLSLVIPIISMLLILMAGFMESTAWARAGGGSSFGSRGSRSFSAPRMPSSPSPSSPFSSPGPGMSSPSRPTAPPGGGFSRSPFLQGMAGGLAGGILGNLLFGGQGYASPTGGTGGGGIGLLDIIILGALAYFGWKIFKRRRALSSSDSYYANDEQTFQDTYGTPRIEDPYKGGTSRVASDNDEVRRGLEQVRGHDPAFNEEGFKELVQDMFFRIQAAWMNRSLEGIEGILSPEMATYFSEQFGNLKESGRINRLENIAIRKVEPTEAWQEVGKDYVTVLFTANLLDYTVDDKTGQVLEGDRLSPVKFQEFWTFCRNIGSSQWQLSAINQVQH